MLNHTNNVYGFVAGRDLGVFDKQSFFQRVHFSKALASKLKVQCVLEGHEGCVNRLAWNDTGDFLLSGSDDKKILVWRYPDLGSTPLSIRTQHQSNIFGVQFLPCTNNTKVVSGAMDHTVQLHDIGCSPHAVRAPATSCAEAQEARGVTGQRRHRQSHNCLSLPCTTDVFNCHSGRVKDVEVEPGNPHNFWSASEDGTIRQFDTRCRNQGSPDSPNVLVNVRERLRTVELKGMDISQARPHMLAIAAEDPYIRIYDRRKIVPGRRSPVATEPLLKLAPPHMTLDTGRSYQRLHATYVNFSSRGDKVLTTYHADQAYSFDVTSSGSTSALFLRPLTSQTTPATVTSPSSKASTIRTTYDPRCGDERGEAGSSNGKVGATSSYRQRKMEEARVKANAAGFEQNLTTAIMSLSDALQYLPNSATVYCQRARALLSRGWPGDALEALRDSETAIAIDSDLAPAHLLCAKALKALGQYKCALNVVDNYTHRFPSRAGSGDACSLHDDLMAALAERRLTHEARAARKRRLREATPPPPPPPPPEQHVENEETGSSARSSSTSEHREGEVEGERDGEQDEANVLSAEDPDAEVLLLYYPPPSAASCSSSSSIWNSHPSASRMHRRYVGHCNVQTDIKECVFVGHKDQMVACASDDGRVLLYDSETGVPIRALPADQDVVNCVQVHPTMPVLATSGYEPVVRVWAPLDLPQRDEVQDIIQQNQEMTQQPGFGLLPRGALGTLAENPLLLQLFTEHMQRLRARSAGAEDSPGDGGDDNSDGDDDEEGGRGRDVTCRIN